MEIRLKIEATELSQDIIDKIRQFITLNGESDLEINIRPKKKKKFPKETKEEYFERLDRAIDTLDKNKNVLSFSTSEFQAFAESKL
jgi:hypothetical protein